jgi:8-oxo-dGTP pyrophosphatase MutT (NUDIX family)
VSVLENVIKESAEEAGIPANLAAHAKPAGAVSYTADALKGEAVKRDVLFVFDLELPHDFVPVAVDGEVESFELMPVNKVIDTVAFTDNYKDNCNLVLIDFFMRHGFVNPDTPGYLSVLAGLRRGECL